MASSIGRASLFLASGTMVSRVLGFVRTIILAQTIGVVGSASADAFAVANQLPNNIYAIIAGGTLSAVLVPQIVRATLHSDGGKGYINKLLTIAMVILAGTTVVATLAAPVLVTVSAPSWSPEQRALGIAFAFWCLPQIFFYGLYTVLGEVLNAKSVFGPFTWAPLVNNVVSIAGLVTFIVLFGADPSGERLVSDWSPDKIVVLAGSTTLAVACQALVLFVFWRRAGIHYRPDFRWRGVGLGAAGKLAGWTFGMLLVTQAAGLVETMVASIASGDAASVATIQAAWLIFMLPHSIITVSIVTAYFTKMSGHANRGETVELRGDVSAAIRVTGLFMVLGTVVLIVVAYPFSSLFTENVGQSVAMGNVLIAFVVGLVPFSALFVLQRVFYSLSNTKTPFFLQVLQATIFTALAIGCAFLPADLIAVGLALALSLATAIQTLVAGVMIRGKLGGVGGRTVVVSFLRFALAALPSAAAGVGTYLALQALLGGDFPTSGFVGPLISMAVIGVVMLAVYLGALFLIRSPELKDALGPLRARLGR
ncbi:murein biosynthesis integral membrane protein MurJ [Herbiconiux sp. KACC 21604]|uniref:murein biosynthesis integral membrane protein MurJ n=1 Tax=unclassified Herbiconiux TaxID=2618217 RepID=UPI001491BE65|nr:murein biosynthesis integral membrane protein MurJ [Herbiconiux sp. SALV-R1]QJU55463.1 murein biosynthesis integral membrane protein MurJ [Herbiconiux sp. SALV-R1]WPO86646.1 murein biosynthesis integral membrane protein MurJ [Herbiconiux sp. KACC 21604]